MSDRAGPFDWSGGHPALDLVNTLDERPFPSPIENLATYADLVRFAELAKLIEPSVAQRLRKLTGPACSRVANQARKLREHLHDVLAAAHSGRPMPQTDLEAIGRAIQAAHSARALVLSIAPGLATHRWSQPIAPRFRCTPVRFRSSTCLSTSTASESGNVARQTVRSTSSTRAKGIAGSGAA